MRCASGPTIAQWSWLIPAVAGHLQSALRLRSDCVTLTIESLIRVGSLQCHGGCDSKPSHPLSPESLSRERNRGRSLRSQPASSSSNFFGVAEGFLRKVRKLRHLVRVSAALPHRRATRSSSAREHSPFITAELARLGPATECTLHLAEGALMAKRKAAKRRSLTLRSDKRSVRRNAQGRFKESDDVRRSLTQDRKRQATTKASRAV